ncbi:MAG TPA: 3D-(3,5/4)-trihydroxycyclohexane-1,2-dione acylhydrolase (decyclizing) [Dermatophilaceae bacterium]|nr:3D-(3,5/4)-trihydroxycyclohexane-1,2-dione acylhydrolase (decyclizing) [Dermatophilaceae bacterium]
MTETVRLTVGQAVVRFLVQQHSERDGVEQRLVTGVLGIFGHGNVCGVGQALLEQHDVAADDEQLPYLLVRNEQGAVHAATGYARSLGRLQTMAVTTSIGPGATNLVTGAALATTNRIPVLLLPADTFATRGPDPVLQQLEDPRFPEATVNDVFRPVSRFFDRVTRPEQLVPALLGAMRVLTDPADTGAVTICLPQDVQAEAFDWPVELFRKRVWHVGRPVPEPAALARAVEVIRSARRPLILAGGGVRYAAAAAQLRALASATGIPVCDTHAGKGAINWDHPMAVGGVGSTGSAAANALAREADVVIGIGTRYSDFTTASHTIFADPDVRFVNVNTLGFDAAKHSATMLVADAREAITALTGALDGWATDAAYQKRVRELAADWAATTDRCYHLGHGPLPAQTEVFGALNELMGPEDVLVNAAGSMPGDLQSLWRATTPVQYHVEYAYSCMGYEIPAAMGARLALGDGREVVAIVGDGTYQMMPMELATIVSERIRVIVVLLDNGGFASIGALSESRGSQRFGTRYRMRNPDSGHLDGEPVPFDLAANAESWGVPVLRCRTIEQFRAAYAQAVAADHPTCIHIATDPLAPSPPSSAWWDVPVAEVSRLDSTRAARLDYLAGRQDQRHYL